MAIQQKRDADKVHQHFKLKKADAHRFKILLVQQGLSLQDWCEQQVQQWLKERRNA